MRCYSVKKDSDGLVRARISRTKRLPLRRCGISPRWRRLHGSIRTAAIQKPFARSSFRRVQRWPRWTPRGSMPQRFRLRFCTQRKIRAKYRVVGKPYDAIAKRFVIASWVADSRVVSSDPQAYARFGQAFHEASVYSNGHLAETVDLVAQFTKIDPQVIAHSSRILDAEYLTRADIQPVIDRFLGQKRADRPRLRCGSNHRTGNSSSSLRVRPRITAKDRSMGGGRQFEAEIREQPAVLARLAESQAAVQLDAAIGNREPLFIGSGSSLFVAQLAAVAWRRLGRRRRRRSPQPRRTFKRRRTAIAASSRSRKADGAPTCSRRSMRSRPRASSR